MTIILMLLLLILFSISLPKMMITLSLSLSLSIYIYISKSWSVVFIIFTLLLGHISSHIIYLFLISLHYFQPWLFFYLFISPLLSILMSLFIYLFFFLLFWFFLSPFYYYKYNIFYPILYIFSHMKKVITLFLTHVLFLCEFFIFCISTLDWCIYVFFRVLLWVAIWFWAFKLLSFFLFYNY